MSTSFNSTVDALIKLSTSFSDPPAEMLPVPSPFVSDIPLKDFPTNTYERPEFPTQTYERPLNAYEEPQPVYERPEPVFEPVPVPQRPEFAPPPRPSSYNWDDFDSASFEQPQQRPLYEEPTRYESYYEPTPKAKFGFGQFVNSNLDKNSQFGVRCV